MLFDHYQLILKIFWYISSFVSSAYLKFDGRMKPSFIKVFANARSLAEIKYFLFLKSS